MLLHFDRSFLEFLRSIQSLQPELPLEDVPPTLQLDDFPALEARSPEEVSPSSSGTSQAAWVALSKEVSSWGDWLGQVTQGEIELFAAPEARKDML